MRADGRRPFALRASVIAFVLMSGVIVLVALAALLMLDPRTQAFWAARWDEFALAVRGVLAPRARP